MESSKLYSQNNSQYFEGPSVEPILLYLHQDYCCFLADDPSIDFLEEAGGHTPALKFAFLQGPLLVSVARSPFSAAGLA